MPDTPETVLKMVERLHDHARNVGGDDSFERLYGSEAVEIATALETLEAKVKVLEEALKPFAECCDQIAAGEDDEEWAKFRLLIKDYRRARAALNTDKKEQ